jgi:uncharacterized membrane protein (DUF4010 family)
VGSITPVVLNLATALGCGLLIGAERERRKGQGAAREPAGIRTFAIASLGGALAMLTGGPWLLLAAVLAVGALTAVAYWRSPQTDPGLTTEIALVVTVMLGGLAVEQRMIAAGVAVAVAVLLALKGPLHRFVGQALTEDEVKDALVFALATLVLLPLLPDRALGPFEALNPHTIGLVVVVVMAVGAAGHAAVRIVGPRFGLPMAGFASGFISSTATIAAFGVRAAKTPVLLRPAAAGAVLSSVATIVQMALILAAISPATLRVMAVPLLAAGAAAFVYGFAFTLLALRGQTAHEPTPGRAFSLVTALIFAATVAVITVGAAALREQFGLNGILAAAALGGFADAHVAAISVATLVAAGNIAPHEAVLPILAGLSTNTASKMIFAVASRSPRYALAVVLGLILILAAAWTAAFLVGLLGT